MSPEDLTDAEHALWAAFPAAATVDLRGAPDDEIRAEVIAALLLGVCPAEPGRVPAVRLVGARITGVLDLSFAEVRVAAQFQHCVFTERPDLRGARLRQLNLAGSRLPGLRAPDVRIDGPLWLGDCQASAPLNLTGAHVDGTLSLRAARLSGDPALRADRLTVTGSLDATSLVASGELLLRGASVAGTVVLNDASLAGPRGIALNADGVQVPNGLFARRIEARGEVRLPDAQLGRRLALTASHLVNPDRVALNADRIRVDGALELDRGARAEGMVVLRAAVIAGTLALDDAELVNPKGVALKGHLLTVGSSLRATGCRAQGEIYLDAARVEGSFVLDAAQLRNPGRVALRARRAEVTGGLFGKYGFRTEGEIQLVDTQIRASVELNGAVLSNPGGTALRAYGISVGRVMDCCSGFTAHGRVALAGARIGGELCFDAATIDAPGENALSCRQVRATALRLGPTTRVDGEIDVRHTRIEVLRDDPGCWPSGSMIDGFTYETIESPGSAEDRLAWLDGSRGYQPQPYEHLAAVYRRLGHDADARTVQLAKQRHRRRTLPRWARIWGFVQDWTVGYGYRPMRPALWLAGLLGIGVLTFGLHHPPPLKPDEAPQFNAVLYSLDLLLPVIGFGQEGAFDPRGWQQWLAAALIAAGWILATAIAAGVTRVLSRQ